MELDLDDLLQQIDNLVENFLGNLKEADYDMIKKAGVDTRAFGHCWYDSGCIVISESDNRRARYYGGFEYVSDDCINVVGNYVVYSADEDRIRSIVERLNELEDEDEDEDGSDD